MSRRSHSISFLSGLAVAVIFTASFLLWKEFFSSSPVFAQETGVFAENIALGTKSPVQIVVYIINWSLSILALLAVVLIIYAGFLYLTSGGNESKIERAKQILKSTLIGLLIILSAWGIALYVLRVLRDATDSSGGEGAACLISSDCQSGLVCCNGTCSSSCSGIPGSSALKVVETIPRNEQTNVALCSLVGAHFSKPVDAASFTKGNGNPNFYLELTYDETQSPHVAVTGRDGDSCTSNLQCRSGLCGDAKKCAGDTVSSTLQFSGDAKWAVLYPVGRELPSFATYEVTVLGGSDGVRSGVLQLDRPAFTWTFSTGKDKDDVPPTVVEKRCDGGENSGQDCTYKAANFCGAGSCSASVVASPYPADGTVNTCLKTALGAEFSETMDPISFDDTESVVVSSKTPGEASFLTGAQDLSLSPYSESFSARPKQSLAPNSDYYVRLYGGKPSCVNTQGESTGQTCAADADCNAAVGEFCDGAFGALLDACGNPLDGNGDGAVNGKNRVDLGSPVDDFISSTDVTPPNDHPWNFKTGEQEICEPEIQSIAPVSAYDGLDNGSAVGPDRDDNGGAGDAGWIEIAGKYLAPSAVISFHGVDVLPDSVTCFNKDFRVAASTNPSETEAGKCVIMNNDQLIRVKIPPDADAKDTLSIDVEGESTTSFQDFNPLSPHITSVTSTARPGDYITLQGRYFGDDEGIVWFRVNGVNYKHAAPPDICGDFWQSDRIIIVVPDIPNLDPGDRITVQVETTGSDGRVGVDGVLGPSNAGDDRDNKIGNLDTFTVSATERPSLCLVAPSCSNNGGTEVTYIGKGFHSDRNLWKGKILFDATEGAVQSWADTEIHAKTPNLSFGSYDTFVQVKDPSPEAQNPLQESNSVSFQSPCGNVPYVVSDGSCNVSEDQFPSPNPRDGAQNVCLNIKASARFSIRMDTGVGAQGILNRANVKLLKCGARQPAEGGCMASGTAVDVVSLTEDPVYNGNEKYDNASFVLTPRDNFSPDTWYSIVVAKNVRSDPNTCFDRVGQPIVTVTTCPSDPAPCQAVGGFCGGVTMLADFVSNFHTQLGDAACAVSDVKVLPQNGYVVNDSTSKQYTAQPYGSQCAILDALDYQGSYQWTDDDPKNLVELASPTNKYNQSVSAPIIDLAHQGKADIVSTLQEKSGNAPFYVDDNFCEEDSDCDRGICSGAQCDEATNRCIPLITSLSPDTGPVGRSITVKGCYFGAGKDDSRDVVTFNGAPAKLVEMCKDTAWQNTQIVVEVPNAPGAASKGVQVLNYDTPGEDAGETPLRSNISFFTVANVCVGYDGTHKAVPATGIPTLCPLGDNRTDIGAQISFVGNKFGSPRTDGKDFVAFTGASVPVVASQYATWSDTNITTTVPAGSVTGKVVAVNEECASNGVDVRVRSDENSCASRCIIQGECRPASDCNVGGSGDSCAKTGVAACSAGFPSCSADTSCLTGDQDGDGIVDDCRCCCTPGDTLPNGMLCLPDKGQCTGSTRGLFCGCQGDSECPDSSVNGCGITDGDYCCSARPKILSAKPANLDTNFCPNGVMEFIFNQKMDTNTFADNFSILDERGHNVEGSFRSSYDNTTKQMRVLFVPKTMFTPNTNFLASWAGDEDTADNVAEGVLSSAGIGMSDSYPVNFKTALTPCDLSSIDLVTEVPTGKLNGNTFTQPDQSGAVHAYARAEDGTLIERYSGIYSWKWEWSLDPDTFINIAPTDTPDVVVDDKNKDKDGETFVKVEALPTGKAQDGYDGSVSQTAPIYVYYCQDPWASEVGNPGFEDILGSADEAGDLPSLNHIIRYCRDGRTPESNFDRIIVKENNKTVIVTGAVRRQETSGPLPSGVLREYLFTKTNPALAEDAIGVRVFANPDRLSPGRWYEKYAPNPVSDYRIINAGVGSTSDNPGYEAVSVGRTVYIAAANHSQTDAGVNQGLYTNIYLISYTDKASQATKSIFEEMVQDWLFNSNIHDSAQKTFLVRDTKRITDLGAVADLLNGYYHNNGQYPDLQAGTFLRYQTTSKWPSWKDTFQKAIGFVPLDPLNVFDPLSQCPESSGFDAGGTCWNADDKQYICPNDASTGAGKSHVYQYKVQENNSFQNAFLYGNLEYNYGGLTWRTGVVDPCSGSSSSCKCFNYQLTGDRGTFHQ